MALDVSEVRGCVCLHTRRAARQLTRFYDRSLRASGLRVTQFQLLAAIHETEPVTQQPLAELLGMDRTTLTRNVGLLARDGLVRVEQDRRDLREHRHTLTPQGRRALESAMPLWRSARASVDAQLGRGAEGLTEQGAVALLSRLSALEEAEKE